MINREKIRSFILILTKVFLIGLLLQFFIQTFITFQLGFEGSVRNMIWMWKEIILVIFLGLVGYISLKNTKQFKEFIIGTKFYQFLVLFLASGLLYFILCVGLQKLGISTFVLTIKYDLLPFFIFGLGTCISLLYWTEKERSLILIYHKVVKFCLWGGLIWRGIIFFIPNLLKFAGYDPHNFEGNIGSAPPAVYYTNISPYAQGSIVRNQFLFERPINFGFRIIAFFPVFALGFLRKKQIKKQIGYGILFGFLVLSTWSRAAIVMFGFEVVVIVLLLHWKVIKKYIRLFCLFLCIGVGGMFIFGNRYFAREHSNTGHFALIQEGLAFASQNLFIGWGAGYAGPASHQICYNALENNVENLRCEQIKTVNDKYEIGTYGFNPENQYIQILMEYGVFGLLARMAMIVWILWYSFKLLWLYRNKLENEPKRLIYWTIFGFSIGLIGLLGEGLLLHSFSDRMVVYPFFLLYGISLGLIGKNEKN